MSEDLVDRVSTHGISRRTALRGAVWTAPVATIAVAAPAYAAHSGVPHAEAEVTSGNPYRESDANIKYVKWRLTLTNGETVLSPLSVAFVYQENSGPGRLTSP